jgi:hypothetical protein
MYYQLLYLNDENRVTIDEYETINYDFNTEFAIALFDKSKKPFAFIELEHTEFDKILGDEITLSSVINALLEYGFSKYASNKSASKLRKEVMQRTNISFREINTGERCDFYHKAKGTVYSKMIYDLKVIDLNTKEEIFVIKNFPFNNENLSYKTIANGIMQYTQDYSNTKEYEEECRIKEEELQRQLQEEERAREQERLRAEAIKMVQEQETKRIEELIDLKIKELEKQETD